MSLPTYPSESVDFSTIGQLLTDYDYDFFAFSNLDSLRILIGQGLATSLDQLSLGLAATSPAVGLHAMGLVPWLSHLHVCLGCHHEFAVNNVVWHGTHVE